MMDDGRISGYELMLGIVGVTGTDGDYDRVNARIVGMSDRNHYYY